MSHINDFSNIFEKKLINGDVEWYGPYLLPELLESVGRAVRLHLHGPLHRRGQLGLLNVHALVRHAPPTPIPTARKAVLLMARAQRDSDLLVSIAFVLLVLLAPLAPRPPRFSDTPCNTHNKHITVTTRGWTPPAAANNQKRPN